MSEWNPKAITRMILQIAAFATILYLVVVGNLTTGDIVSIAGILTGAVGSFIGEPRPVGDLAGPE